MENKFVSIAINIEVGDKTTKEKKLVVGALSIRKSDFVGIITIPGMGENCMLIHEGREYFALQSPATIMELLND